ncbi:MAG: hemolysin family protein [Streptosporangiales bacterium]
MTGPIGWVLFAALLAANAFFVSAEFSLTSVDRIRLTRVAADGSRRARSTLTSVRELSTQLSGAQLGITFASLLVGFVAEPTISEVLEPGVELLHLPEGVTVGVSAVVALLLATLVQMLLGELVPQNLAIARPLGTALAIAPMLRIFSTAGRPVIALFNGTANQVVRLVGIEPQQELRSARTPAELSSLIDSSARQGALPTDVAALLRRSLAFSDRSATEVMTPRVHMDALRTTDTVTDLLDLARRTGHSRFPVHAGDVDEIVGTVHVKHAFGVRPARRDETPVRLLMRPPVRVPQSLRCDDLLLTLRRRGLQLAVVVDEYGGTAGVVTLEDLLEELVGAVRDEYDLSETPEAVRLTDGTWSVSGLLRKDELAERVGLRVPEGAYDTVAGLILATTGELPEPGDTATLGDWAFTVTRMDGRRIDRVIVRPPEENGGEDGDDR